MGQLLIRQLDDADIDRLRVRAKARRTSVEALARDAIRNAARLTVAEKYELVRNMQAKFEALKDPAMPQTPGWILIREGRDSDDR